MSHPPYLAFLAALPFTGILWGVFWSARYIPVPIKGSLLRLAVQLAFSAVLIGTWVAQIRVYLWVAGLGSGDNVIVGLVIAENVIGFALVLLAARARQQRMQGNQSGT